MGIFSLIIVILGILWFLLWYFYLSYFEWTDDAYANGNLININPAVPGSVIAFFADDTDFVKEGQLLVLLDKTAYEVAFQKELAALSSTMLDVRQLYENVLVNQAIVERRQIAEQRALYDFENRSKLVGSQAISNEDFVHAKDEYLGAVADLKQAEHQLQMAIDARGNTSIEMHPLIEKQKRAIYEAYYNLSHTAIYAPADGFVAQRFVNVGEWAEVRSNLMAIIPKDYMWVDANYKETQLTRMRIGQPATVTFDLYGRKSKMKGKVLGIASGTGSVFSLIPPQNATGNWIKIVQRLPVRISLDPEIMEKFPIRLGISAEVDVDLTNQDLPFLAEVTPKKAVGETTVFKLDFKEVNQLIDKIIHEASL